MSKRVERPWDKRRAASSARGQQRQRRMDADSSSLDTPFIQVGEYRYYSDRFYLNKTVFDEELPGGDFVERSASCSCGGAVYLDRSALVASLDIQAAILATYTLDLEAMKNDFPTLFAEDSKIPTLVLHGLKGTAAAAIRKHNEVHAQSSIEMVAPDSPTRDESNTEDIPDGNAAMLTSSEYVDISHVTPEAATWRREASLRQSLDNSTGVEQQKAAPSNTAAADSSSLSGNLHISRILPCWLPPKDIPRLVLDSKEQLSKRIFERRERKSGVHHPKFMLLWETSGSLVVLVSTANLTEQCTIDGTWVQRFPPRTTPVPEDNFPTKRTTTEKNTPFVGQRAEDAGRILGHMLDCQTWAIATPEDLTPLAFGRRYLGWEYLLEPPRNHTCQLLHRTHDFSCCQVYLIPHVPGMHDTTEDAVYKYGRYCVHGILHSMSSFPQGSKDRLVIQPTSFGSDWSPLMLADVAQSYLNTNKVSCDKLLKRVHIVWPTDELVRSAVVERHSNEISHGRGVPNKAVMKHDETGKPNKAVVKHDETGDEGREGYLFLSTDAFNSIHLSCLSQMVLFQPTKLMGHRIPHFKSICRVYRGGANNTSKKIEHRTLSWFLLTSACLSRGAQGIRGEEESLSDKSSFVNFELGVLFVSRTIAPKRMYMVHKARQQCACKSRSQNTVSLPLPFQLQPKRYQPDPEESDFAYTPYFHEITRPLTGHVQLTPLGRKNSSNPS